MLIVLEGHLCRTTAISTGTFTEIIGPGDAVQVGHTGVGLPESLAWLALIESQVMVVDRTWLEAMSSWPAVALCVKEGLLQTLARSRAERAVRECDRVDERLELTLHCLAQRWGRAHHEGVVIQVEGLTHEILAALTGARRATISSAMNRLAGRGRLARTPNRRWILLDA